MNRKLNDSRSFNRPYRSRGFSGSDYRSRLDDARGGFRANGDGFRDSFRDNIAGFRDDLRRRDADRDTANLHDREISRDAPDKDNFSENFHERLVDYRKDVRTNKPESGSQREAF